MDSRKNTIGSASIAAMSGTASQSKGLSMGMTAFFLVAQMAGAGFLALPRGVADSGWVGVAMIVIFCCSVAFVGTRLGRSWVILEERWPEQYKGSVRQPYMDIAERSLGQTGRKITLWSVVLNLYGSTTVHMILISEMVAAVVKQQTGECDVTKCHVIIIVGLCLIPLTWLGSPKDFWQGSILAVVATTVAVVVIVVEIFVGEENIAEPEYPNPTVSSFALGFGAILFAFGGAAVFPTIQNDMEDRSQFWKSIILGFTGILSLYLPVALVGYVKIGDAVKSNILLSVEMTTAVLVAISMEIINLLCTFVISSNPVHQSVEEVFGVPNKFGPRRIIVRSSLVAVQILIGLAVPNFGTILNLIGGSLITLCTFILPPVMYIRLMDDKTDKTGIERIVPLWERLYLYEIVTVGLVGGVLSTITAVFDVIEASFNNSCFTHFSVCEEL